MIRACAPSSALVRATALNTRYQALVITDENKNCFREKLHCLLLWGTYVVALQEEMLPTKRSPVDQTEQQSLRDNIHILMHYGSL